MKTIFRKFIGCATGDMNNIFMPSVTSLDGFEKSVRTYLADKFESSPECDKPKIRRVMITYDPGECDLAYPYVVSYVSYDGPEPKILGSIEYPFFEEIGDIFAFPDRDVFYHFISLGEYEDALTKTASGAMIVALLKMPYKDVPTTFKTEYIRKCFEHLDDDDIAAIYELGRKYRTK